MVADVIKEFLDTIEGISVQMSPEARVATAAIAASIAVNCDSPEEGLATTRYLASAFYAVYTAGYKAGLDHIAGRG
jgi:hypothetical protein